MAHAKSGDAAMIAGYAGNSKELDDAMVRFAFAYADQNEKDFKALAEAGKKWKDRSWPLQNRQTNALNEL